MKKILGILVLLLVLGILCSGGILAYFLLEGTPPVIRVAGKPGVIGRTYRIEVQASDDRSGLKLLSASVLQEGKKIPVATETFPVTRWWMGSGLKETRVSWVIRPLALGLSQGDATLEITARDSSLRNGLKGNERVLSLPIKIDTTPPRIALKSLVHNIMAGGSGVVSYRLSEEPRYTGVRVDDRLFPAYPNPRDGKLAYTAFVAIPFNHPSPRLFAVEAVDQAGNIARVSVPYRVMRQKKVRDTIRITDGFLQRKMPDFQVRHPELKGSLIQVFLYVNKELRAENNRRIQEICSKGSPEMMWQGRFLRLPRSAKRANFADFRRYLYKGREIGQAYHMGVDLASTSHAKVPASNSGVVVFADYLGIYGNTVIIDHGMGLFTTYSHLSEIMVSKGDKVQKGQIIGRTGATGLAGGDHLHYGMLISGVFVNPVEWWDRRWIKTHVLANL